MTVVESALAQFFSQSRLPVLFAGAGVSARAGLPTWGDYLKLLAAAAAEYDEYTKYFIDDAVSDGAFEDAATYYIISRKIPESRKLEELRKPLLKFDSARIKSIVDLPFQSVVTTNFDRALFHAYAKHTGQSAREINIDDLSLDAAPFEQDLYIARIHGREEVPSSMRLSKEHFAGLLTNSSYTGFLEHLFTRRQVLFVGFSFFDPAIRSVLRAVRATSGSMHGQEHWALVPKGAASEFIGELEAHSIRRVEYDPANRHQALWEGIDAYAQSKVLLVTQTADVRDQPFAVAKKYLATAFARARIGKQKEPLAQAMAEGVVSGIINSTPTGLTEEELVNKLSLELSISPDVSRSLVAQSVTALSRDGICGVKSEGNVVRFVPREGRAFLYDEAVARLADGVVQRYLLREKGVDSPAIRMFLEGLFGQLLLQRGWELGASYAGRRMPEDVDVSDVMDQVNSTGIRPGQFAPIERSIRDLLIRPDDEEATLLADLGRTAFGLELLLEAPNDSLFLSRALPERIYFDANVVMPAITAGHPLHVLFSETIKALKASAGGAAVSVSLRVYDGFLNEIISHRRLARESMLAQGGEGAVWEERAVGLYGTANVNVYVGAYFNFRSDSNVSSFEEFLHHVAPYETENDLKRYLEKQGFEVVRENQVAKRDSAGILHCLEKFYAGKLEQRRKSAVVVRHDAAQLAIINAELQAQVRSILVSADRGIRFALENEGYSVVANAVMTHVGLAQFVELMIGRLPVPRGMASLLWMSPVSSDSERIRNYLVGLALREHDAALSMSMADLVGDVAEDAQIELAQKSLSLDTEATSDRAEVNRVLERYEKDFFRRMNAEVARRSSR